MLLYNIRLAWKSIRRDTILSILIVGGIALGVGVSTAFITLHHVLSTDPIPEKSDVLHYVRMDSWDPAKQAPHVGGIPTQITYRDMLGITESDIPRRQAAMYKSRMYVYPEGSEERPFQEMVRLTHRDFFELFRVPFLYGGPWSEAAERKPDAVVVLDREMNERLFGGGDSVGETVRIADRDFTVVGVLAEWSPKIKFYDMTQNPYQEREHLLAPLPLIEPMEITSSGNRDGWTGTEGDTFLERLYNSEQVFLQMWVELPGAGARKDYEDFLAAYVAEQKKLGRFQRPMDNRVTPLPDLMEEWGVVPHQATALAVVSVLFLAVCSVNLIGLFLGKFLARAPTVAIRRALGASRKRVFLQHIVECELMGAVGGFLGLVLSLVGLAVINRVVESTFGTEKLVELDATMLLAAVFLSLVAGLAAGLYPAWRICHIPPANYLKNQ
jgi:putative ABC transport system permease protein